MIHSMTGYGDAHAERGGVSHALEIRSLNNRYFKAAIKLPEHLQFLEGDVERLLRSRLTRGSVNYYLRVRQDDAAGAYEINAVVVESYLSTLRKLVQGGERVTIDLATLVTLPGVCEPPELDEQSREREWTVIESLTNEALDRLVAMRQQEGAAIREDLLGHCAGMRRLIEQITGRVPLVVDDYKKRLQTRVNTLLSEAELELDADTLAREVAVFADRCDISEELHRLSTHLDQFVVLCDGGERTGRRLDFIAQEMLRESNTIGSKSNDAEIASCVVNIKSLVDRIKEQVQNVE